MRIALITTGKTEHIGLPKALSRLFSPHEFVGIEDVPGRTYHGFTSDKLPLPPAPVPPMIDKMIARAASLVDPEVVTDFDLVIMLDDLELANRDQPQVVVEVVRESVARHLVIYSAKPERQSLLARALQAKVSFHLAVPMIESWFFGAPAALSGIGVGGVAYHVRAGDHEDFESTDRQYMKAQPTDCPKWSRSGDRGDRPKWIGAGTQRVFHPKGYIQWLMIDGTHKCCTTYSESSSGAIALENIDWARLLSNGMSATYARALIRDLESALGVPALGVPAGGVEAPLTSVHTVRANPILRNL